MKPDTPDPVYDRDRDKPITRPDLRELEEGGRPSAGAGSGSGSSSGSSFNFNPEGDQASKSGGDNAGGGDNFNFSGGGGKSGSTGTTGAASSLMSKELAASTGVAGAAATFATGAKNFFLGSRRRKQASAGGGIAAALLGGSILLLTAASGPAELVHLSQLLQHNFTLSQSDSESRTSNLLRSWKAYKEDDYRYTRVGYIGQKVMAKVVEQYKEAGVEFTGKDLLGRPTKIEVDRSAVEEKFPETKSMTDAEFNEFLNEKIGVESDSGLSFATEEAGSTYSLDIEGLQSSSISSFIDNVNTKLLGNSKVVTAVATRALKAFFGLQSLFHPFSKAIQDKISAKAAQLNSKDPEEAEETAASEVENSEFDAATADVQAPGVAAHDEAHQTEKSFSDKLGTKLAPGAGVLWAAGCTLKGVSGAIVTMNRSLVVLPSALEASQLISTGSQIMNGGGDVTADQVSATVRGFTDSNGQNIWSGAALRAIQDPDATSKLPKNSQGQIENNLPGEYQQAFGTDTTSNTLNSAGDVLLSWFPFHWVSVPGVSECGFVGGLSIVIGGIAFQAVNAVINLPDADVGDIALNAAAQAGEETAIQGVQGKLLGPIISNVVKKIAETSVAPKLTREAFSGSTGGNLIAYGARAAANSAAILNGGLAMGNNAATAVGSVGQEQQQQFRSEGFFAKIFDINDYRSLTGRLATGLSPGVSSDLQTGTNNIFNIGGTLASVFGNLIPHIAADSSSDSWTGDYDWGFPQYAIPQNMLNDPALSDPYQNAENVGKYLSGACSDGSGNIGPDQGACGGSNGYTARIANCFGNTLSYSQDSDTGTEVWDVVHSANAANGDINPASDSYLGANCGSICSDTIADCGNSAEEQWEKIVMFVNDANNIKALDCLGGYTDTSDQSCTDIGYTGTASSSGTSDTGTATGTSDSGTLPTGTSQQLAQQLLPYIKSGKIFCGPAAGGSGAADCTDIQNTAKGVPVGGDCQVNAITPHLLGLILGLVRDDGWTLGISAMCSDHHVEADGPYGGHSNGSAADFAVQNGISGQPASTDQKFVDDAAALLSATGGSFGQVATGGTVDTAIGACHVAYPSQKGFTLFEDTCNHQHIRAAP